MTEAESSSSPERDIPVEELILQACRDNAELYTSPTGLGLQIGDVPWQITYWPSWIDQEGTHKEKLSISRGKPDDEAPVSYLLGTDGKLLKNDTILHRIPGGVYFHPDGNRPVEDKAEADTLLSIVYAAHALYKKD